MAVDNVGDVGCRLNFPRMEVVELFSASILLALMFLVAYDWPIYVAVLIGSTGLIIHELAHKVAGRYLCVKDVHFTIVPATIILGFVTALFFGFVFAAPGGVTGVDNSSDKERMWMASAGPMTNFALFFGFWVVHMVSPLIIVISGAAIPVFYAVALVNLFIALFNLVPLPPIDGWHIFSTSKKVWGIQFLIVGIFMVAFWGQFQMVVVPMFDAGRGGIIGVFGIMIAASTETKYPWYVFHSVLDHADRLKIHV